MITTVLMIMLVLSSAAQVVDLVVDFRYWRKHGRVAYLLRDDWWSLPLTVLTPVLLVLVGVATESRPTVIFGMVLLLILLAAVMLLPSLGRRQR